MHLERIYLVASIAQLLLGLYQLTLKPGDLRAVFSEALIPLLQLLIHFVILQIQVGPLDLDVNQLCLQIIASQDLFAKKVLQSLAFFARILLGLLIDFRRH